LRGDEAIYQLKWRAVEMKKYMFISVLLAVVFAVSVSLAQEESKNVKKDYSINVGESQIVSGLVGTIVPSDMSKPSAKMSITDENGASIEFTVRPSALIFTSSAGSLLTLHDVKPGDQVTVNFRKKDGINEAVAVKVVK
jgi:hypothetical protein